MKDVHEIGVRVTYKDKDLRPTYTKTYSLIEYTRMIESDLTRLISDVENLAYMANDNLGKEDWSRETYALFNRIKHKLLDKAGEVSRIPEDLIERRTEPMSNFVARLLNEGDDGYGESCLGSQD